MPLPLLAVQTKPNHQSLSTHLSAPAPNRTGEKLRAAPHQRAPTKMHRQLSLSASASASSPRQQQQQDGAGNAAAQAMAATGDEWASHSKADRARPAREERAIHLIPLLTFLCFLLLFLCSRDPSASGTFPPLPRRAPARVICICSSDERFAISLSVPFKICRASLAATE